MLANGYDPKAFDPPKRVEVEYYGAFDLLLQAVGEGGPYWEE
jgi:hypothetical protein